MYKDQNSPKKDCCISWMTNSAGLQSSDPDQQALEARNVGIHVEAIILKNLIIIQKKSAVRKRSFCFHFKVTHHTVGLLDNLLQKKMSKWKCAFLAMLDLILFTSISI